jgi:DNA-binding transcriptional LysR family regulator
VNDHTEAIKVKGAFSSNDGDVVLRWALEGHGILIRSEWDLAKYLQSGRLNLVVPNTVLPSVDLFCLLSTARKTRQLARAFMDFLVGRLQAPLSRSKRAPNRAIERNIWPDQRFGSSVPPC